MIVQQFDWLSLQLVPLGFLLPLITSAAKFLLPALPSLISSFTAAKPAQPPSSAIQAFSPAPVPMTRSEIERRQAAQRIYATPIPVSPRLSGPISRAAQQFTNGQFYYRRRRRMNPANVRALRRAIRRVRSFQRVTGKVSRLLPSRRYGHAHYVSHRPRRRRWRGDIPFDGINPYAAEDFADYMDEAEDFGFDPFPGDEE